MLGGEINSHPIQILVNYWKIRPSLMGAKLDELLRDGVNHVATFVPWQAVETDISHALSRFLQAATERDMTVLLILSPEVGVHYPNSGLPKDVISKAENAARTKENEPASIGLPPNVFNLPSLFAPEFTKRYFNFLSRMDSLLADTGRLNPKIYSKVTAAFTGSFWKYYRSPRTCTDTAFGGAAGEYSNSAALAYRQCVTQFYARREFSDPNASAVNRWKTRAMDDVNRRWFHQQSEDVFRSRSVQFIGRKASQLAMNQLELFTPEADPGTLYSHLLQTIAGAHADFSLLSRLVDEAAARQSGGTQPFVHWTSLGGFRTLSDAEKQFLILKSLLLMGGRGGGIFIDEREWFSLSHAFRARAEALGRSISQGELRLKNRMTYLAPHLWTGPGTLWDETFRRLGSSARLVSSVDAVLSDMDSQLLLVDPSFVFTLESVQQLCGWARGGRVVALPRSPLYTESAKRELERITHERQGIAMDLGVSYRLYDMSGGGHGGKLVVYELPEGVSMQGESLSAWQAFLNSVLSVSDIRSTCTVSDSRLKTISMEKKHGGIGLFILNGSGRAIAADLLFPLEVSVSDLASSFAESGPGGARGAEGGIAPAHRFNLEVPPCGVLPLAVEPTGMDPEERRAAQREAQNTRDGALRAAASELPGLEDSARSDIEALWN